MFQTYLAKIEIRQAAACWECAKVLNIWWLMNSLFENNDRSSDRVEPYVLDVKMQVTIAIFFKQVIVTSNKMNSSQNVLFNSSNKVKQINDWGNRSKTQHMVNKKKIFTAEFTKNVRTNMITKNVISMAIVTLVTRYVMSQ